MISQIHWNKNEIEFLIKNYKIMPYIKISKKLNRTIASVLRKAGRLQLVKNKKWSKKEIILFKKLMKTKSYPEISQILNRRTICLRTKACTLGLKNKNLIRILDISNKKFGKLKAIKFLYTDKRYNAIWKCECDCNKIVNINSACLIRGATRSCGCSRRDKQYESIVNQAYSSHLYTAKIKKIKSNLSKEQYLNIILNPCVYCGEFSIRKNSRTGAFLYLNSVDRINNERYYKISNTQPTCFICQNMKSVLKHKSFCKKIRKISEFMQGVSVEELLK